MWDHIEKDKLMLEWLEMVELGDYALRAWIDGLIAADKMAA